MPSAGVGGVEKVPVVLHQWACIDPRILTPPVSLQYHDVQAPMTCYLEYLTAPLRERGYLWDAQAKLEVRPSWGEMG